MLCGMGFCQDYSMLLNRFSFDFAESKYPHKAWKTTGTAVFCKNYAKLIPAVPYRAGELIMRQKLRSMDIQVDVQFTVKSDGETAPFGFAMWYINSQKPIKDSKGNLFGFKGDYSGLGIFFYRDQGGNWVIHANLNRGMEEYQLSPDTINDSNACGIDGNIENVKRSIR